MKTDETIFYDGKHRKIWIDGGYKEFSFNKKNIQLHRHLWEQDNGLIPEGSVVHHIDGDKLNNNLDNLECMPRSDHTKLHIIGHTLSEKTKKKISEAHKGFKHTEKTKKKMSEAHSNHNSSEKYLYTIYDKNFGYIYGYKKPQKFYKKFNCLNIRDIQHGLKGKDSRLFTKGKHKGIYVERSLKV